MTEILIGLPWIIGSIGIIAILGEILHRSLRYDREISYFFVIIAALLITILLIFSGALGEAILQNRKGII